MSKKEVLEVVRRALAEDIGDGDLTTEAVFPKAKTIQAKLIAKEQGVLAGIVVSMAAFKMLDSKIKFMPLVLDGEIFKSGAIVACLEGNIHPILSAERTALNLLSHLSGVATLTSKFVKSARPYAAKIMDTRKTTPGLRALEKYAVSAGGGYNHRMGLYDQVLIKDNHLKALGYDWPAIERAINGCRAKRIISEVEVENLDQFKEALKLRPDIIMLDNMDLAQIKSAVRARDSLSAVGRRPLTKLEVSGGVKADNIKRIASTGVEMISVGAITHSAKPVDFSLEVV